MLTKRIKNFTRKTINLAGTPFSPFLYWWESFDDLLKSAEEIPKENKNLLKRLSGIYTGFAVTLPVHELIHKLTGEAIGGNVSEVRINNLFGGKLYELLFPSYFDSYVDWSLVAGYTKVENVNNLQTMSAILAPYPLHAALGFYLVQDGIRRKNIFEVGAGSINVIAPVINFHGDFMVFSYSLIDYLRNGVQMMPQQHDLTYPEGIAYTFAGLIFSGLFYKTTKSVANTIKRYFQRK